MDDNYEGNILGTFQKPVIDGFFILSMLWKSSEATSRNIYFYCAPFGFYPFWPGYPDAFLNNMGCPYVVLRAENMKGRVELVSNDPTDMPKVNSGYFSSGPDADLDAMQEATSFFRSIFDNITGNAFIEIYPCNGNVCSVAEQRETLRTQAWSHHTTSTCAVSSGSDPMAVLDSKLRVRGVKNLRVVDGSAFPRVPGAFPVAATFMLSEKASADILLNAKTSGV